MSGLFVIWYIDKHHIQLLKDAYWLEYPIGGPTMERLINETVRRAHTDIISMLFDIENDQNCAFL